METGLDRLFADNPLSARIRGKKIGLLVHPASVDKRGAHISSIVRSLGANVVINFGPEHGFGGEAQDMIGVADARDRFGAPIRSLYGDAFSDLSPRAEDLRGIDLLVIDLQDVGSRYYTFVWTAVLALRAAHAAGVPTLLLDRPNPIGSSLVEGPLLLDAFKSFVGLENVPIRHACTVGEIVSWRAANEGISKDALSVVTVRNAASDARSWDRPFVHPSPNMPTYETALVYPGGCLLEGTNLSEGRGTTKPFEMFGAPWLDGVKLAEEFAAIDLPGVMVRPTTFHPMFHKHAGTICGGVVVHVRNADTFRPIEVYLNLIALAAKHAPDHFRFRTERYEFVDTIPAFDLLMGSDRVRLAMLEGKATPAFLRNEVAERKDALQRTQEVRSSLSAFEI